VRERSQAPLLEVYAGQFDADGVAMVFEAYLPVDTMEEEARTIVVALVPLVVGALVLFLAVELPLAVALSRRVEKAQLDRSKMMRHALLASDLERRRMAGELHDGVIQDLAGLGYALPLAARELRDGGDLSMARTLLDRAAGIIQQDGSLLRHLMTDIYPPDIEAQGLRETIHELVHSQAMEAGLTADLTMAPELALPPDAARLAYRVIREGMRNVVKHADARQVTVELGLDSDQVLVRITDDGRGFGSQPGVGPEGHLGLRLLEDTVSDFGGRLELLPATTGGATLEARFPVALVPDWDR
jgi:signal transduction histidine kinase